MTSPAAPKILLAVALAATAAEAQSKSDLACDEQKLPGSRYTFVCNVEAAPAARALRFAVGLSGSHDDSSSSLSLRWGDDEVTCGGDSKTNSEGEDGNVRLVCRFTVPALPGPARKLFVSLKASHVEFEGYELAPD